MCPGGGHTPVEIQEKVNNYTSPPSVVSINLFHFSSLQFDPAPRRGEPHVTRRTPDYFL